PRLHGVVEIGKGPGRQGFGGDAPTHKTRSPLEHGCQRHGSRLESSPGHGRDRDLAHVRPGPRHVGSLPGLPGVAAIWYRTFSGSSTSGSSSGSDSLARMLATTSTPAILSESAVRLASENRVLAAVATMIATSAMRASETAVGSTSGDGADMIVRSYLPSGSAMASTGMRVSPLECVLTMVIFDPLRPDC